MFPLEINRKKTQKIQLPKSLWIDFKAIMETKRYTSEEILRGGNFFAQMQLFSSFSYFYFYCYGEIQIIPSGLRQCNALSACNMNSKQSFSWQHDITMNETEILGVCLRDFVRSSNGLCSHTIPPGIIIFWSQHLFHYWMLNYTRKGGKRPDKVFSFSPFY